jgi:hypothetical protein
MQQHLPATCVTLRAINHKKPFAYIWPTNGQTAENRAKPSPPSHSPLDLSPDKMFLWPADQAPSPSSFFSARWNGELVDPTTVQQRQQRLSAARSPPPPTSTRHPPNTEH